MTFPLNFVLFQARAEGWMAGGANRVYFYSLSISCIFFISLIFSGHLSHYFVANSVGGMDPHLPPSGTACILQHNEETSKFELILRHAKNGFGAPCPAKLKCICYKKSLT